MPPTETCEVAEMPVFRPSLYLAPVNVLPSAYKTLTRFFPDIEVIVYYGSVSNPTIPGSRIIRSGRLNSTMEGL